MKLKLFSPPAEQVVYFIAIQKMPKRILLCEQDPFGITYILSSINYCKSIESDISHNPKMSSTVLSIPNFPLSIVKS